MPAGGVHMNVNPAFAPDEQPELSVSAAATVAGVSRRTIYNWIALARIRYVRNAGGNIRIYRSSLFREGTVARPAVDDLKLGSPNG